MITLTLYTKEGCGLCEDVKRELAALAPIYPHALTEIDITGDPALFRRYCFTIPVLRVDDVELEAPITRQQLVAALRKATP